MTRTIWLASYPKSGNTWFRMLVANLSANDGKPVDINDLPERSGIASAREPFDHLLLIDSGLLTHDEIDCLRPRVYEELARGAEDDEYDVPEDAPPVRFVKVHDAYTLTPNGRTSARRPARRRRRDRDRARSARRGAVARQSQSRQHRRSDRVHERSECGLLRKRHCGSTSSSGRNCQAGAVTLPAGSTRPTFRFI